MSETKLHKKNNAVWYVLLGIGILYLAISVSTYQSFGNIVEESNDTLQSVTDRGSITNNTVIFQDKIGIGTDTPREPLTIMSGTESNIFLRSDTINQGEHKILFGFTGTNLNSAAAAIVGKRTGSQGRGIIEFWVSGSGPDGNEVTSSDKVLEINSQGLKVVNNVFRIGQNTNSGAKVYRFTQNEAKAGIWSVPTGSFGGGDIRFTASAPAGVAAESTVSEARMKISHTGGVAIGNGYMSSTPTDGELIVEDSIGVGTDTPNAKLHIAGKGIFEDDTKFDANINVSGTIYYGALEANSPHALLQDESGHTRICMMATDGNVVYKTIQLINNQYQDVYTKDTTGVCDKVLLHSQERISLGERLVDGEPRQVIENHKTYQNIWTKETELRIEQVLQTLPDYHIDYEYNIGEVFVYEGIAYEVIQEHTSQEDWKPNELPALYKIKSLQEYNIIQDWKQPLGSHDCYKLGDRVTFNGKLYESTHSCNVWQPPTLWKEVN